MQSTAIRHQKTCLSEPTSNLLSQVSQQNGTKDQDHAQNPSENKVKLHCYGL